MDMENHEIHDATINFDKDDDLTDAEYVPEKDDTEHNESHRRSSVVWKYFKTESGSAATCNYCHKTLSYRTTVSNLMKHLRRTHGDVIRNWQDNDGTKSNLTDNHDDESETDTKPIRKSVPRRSDTWKYFESYEGDTKLANCKMCHKDVSFHSVSELKFHVSRHHGKIELGDVASSDGEKDVLQENNHEHQSSKRKKRSEGWKYFEMKDPVKKIATCKVCRKHLSFQTISNLMKHVIRAHSKTSSFSNDDQEERVGMKRPSYTLKVKPQTQFRSALWKLYNVVDAESKVARCVLCSNNFSYNCLSNLKKHLQRKHEGVLEGQSSDEEVEEEVEVDQNTAVWAYFKCLDQVLKIASCLICKKRVEYNDERELSKHLSRKHPRVDLEGLRTKPKKLMITGNGDLYEIDDTVAKQEPISVAIEEEENDSNDWPYDTSEIDTLNTEYVNEDIFAEPPHVSSKKRPKLSNERTSNIRLQRNEDDTTLDIFGKYIISLMKKLPKHKSDKLQADFVRQIMEAQLNDQDLNNCCKATCIQNTRYISQSNDDTHVSSNSEVQKVITRDGMIQDVETSNEVIDTSVAQEVTVTSEN